MIKHYKKNTNDTRESAAAYICNSLLNEGATVHIFDPKINREQILAEMNFHGFLDNPNREKEIISHESPYNAARNASAIVILTEWDMFKTLDFACMYEEMQKPACIFDGRNILDHNSLKKIGFKVAAIGKSEFSR